MESKKSQTQTRQLRGKVTTWVFCWCAPWKHRLGHFLKLDTGLVGLLAKGCSCVLISSYCSFCCIEPWQKQHFARYKHQHLTLTLKAKGLCRQGTLELDVPPARRLSIFKYTGAPLPFVWIAGMPWVKGWSLNNGNASWRHSNYFSNSFSLYSMFYGQFLPYIYLGGDQFCHYKARSACCTWTFAGAKDLLTGTRKEVISKVLVHNHITPEKHFTWY